MKKSDPLIEKAAQKYRSGKLSISGAAHQADLTVWDMEQYLVDRGFKSNYSVEDLKREAGKHSVR